MKLKHCIFEIIPNLAKEYSATDLSKGYPDFDCSKEIKEIAIETILKSSHQYTDVLGDIELRNKLSQKYQENYNLDYNLQNEITITCGAQEAIFSAIKALVKQGDEVIVFEPFYPFYIQAIKVAGGTPIFVELEGPNFDLFFDKLASAISNKTKLILLNTPHNPTGKVFSHEELKKISLIAVKNDLIVLSDEVYEHQLFDRHKHTPIATLDGMKERTITISSLGKTFLITGWKIGWVCAPKHITEIIRLKRKESNGSIATPLQIAASKIIELLNNKMYMAQQFDRMSYKRNLIVKKLKELNINVYKPGGAFYLVIDISSFTDKNDFDFCVNLIKDHSLAAIPLSAFYSNENRKMNYIRLCFAKKDETLFDAVTKLEMAIKVHSKKSLLNPLNKISLPVTSMQRTNI